MGSVRFWTKATIFIKEYKLSRLSIKAKMENWRTEWGKCGKQGWECKEWDGNVDAENQCGNAGNLCGNMKNVGNQGGDAGNQGGNLSIVVEITWNSNRNDKLKDQREVKIINLVRHAVTRIRTCAEPEFRLCWMTLCSSDNHYTMASLTFS